MCSRSSVIVERFWMGGWFWVEVWGKALSPSHERRWLILLGGIISVVFELRTCWVPNVGT
jgi:hypothetical protein